MSDTPARVLIVDDSKLMQSLMTHIVSSTEGFTVAGVAGSAEEGWDAVGTLKPDLITLDLELPGRHGLKLLARVMRECPLPVLIVSAFGGPGAENTIRALELGATDFIEKPDGEANTFEHFSAVLAAALKRAANSRRGAVPAPVPEQPAAPPARVTAPPVLRRMPLIAIGASTGGVPAIQRVMQDLAPYRLPMVVVQHMPPGYTAKLANRLAALTGLHVQEAAGGEKIQPGYAFVAPGGPHHLHVENQRGELFCRVKPGPLVSGHAPSVDEMFRSVAKTVGGNAIGVLLTGMGRDGAEGLLAMHEEGAPTITQSAETCVVIGMPRAARELGASRHDMGLDQIGAGIIALISENSRHAAP
jgi:two-component system chemotaxis response regulator CheB